MLPLIGALVENLGGDANWPRRCRVPLCLLAKAVPLANKALPPKHGADLAVLRDDGQA